MINFSTWDISCFVFYYEKVPQEGKTLLDSVPGIFVFLIINKLFD